MESFSEKFKSWNTSLSSIQIRGSLSNKAALRPVYEARSARHSYSKSTSALNELAKDSAVDLSDLREWYSTGDKIFDEHEQNSRRHGQGSRDRSQSRICASARGSTNSDFDDDALFLQRIEATRQGQVTREPYQPNCKPMVKPRRLKHSKSMSRVTMGTGKALPPLPDGELQPHIKKSFMDSIRSSRHLRNMRSLTQLKVSGYVNPHESMDFRCVGSPVEAVSALENAFEERELQNERGELLRSINLTRTRMCDQRIEILERSAYLDREAREAANDLDRFDSVPAGSTVSMDQETATAQLIGPAGYSGLATGERWASLQYQVIPNGADADGSRGRLSRHASQTSLQTKPVLKLNTKVDKLARDRKSYHIYTAITGASWRSIGMARTSVDRRWVVLLSASGSCSEYDDAKSVRTILTPASSVRAPRSKSRARGIASPMSPILNASLPLAISYGTMTPSYSDDDDSIPANPSIPVTPILGTESTVGARAVTPIMSTDWSAGLKGGVVKPPKLRCHSRNTERLTSNYGTLAPDYRQDEDRSPVTPVLVI